MVLCTHLNTICTLQQKNCCIGYIESSHGCTNEVVTTGAVNYVQLLTIPLHMVNGTEYAISVLLLNGEVIADGIVLCDTSSTVNYSCLIEQAFCQGCLTTTVITQQGNVFDFLCLISFHRVLVLVYLSLLWHWHWHKAHVKCRNRR